MERKHILCVVFLQLFFSRQLIADVCPPKRNACLYPNTYAVSTKMQNVTKREVFPHSCASFCAMKEWCIGVNENIDLDICQALGEDDDIPGLVWDDSPGYEFLSFETPCPKVQWSHVVIISMV